MTIRCGLCGYENSEAYRFCGMCGAALHPPEPALPARASRSPQEPGPSMLRPREEPPPEKPVPVTGPSFLGLSQEPEKGGVEYLLEEEEPRGRAGTVIVVLVLVAVGLAAWYWRDSYAPLLAKLMPSVSNAPVNGGAPQGGSPSAGTPPVGSGVATSPSPSQPMGTSPAESVEKQAPAPTPSDESHMVVPDDQTNASPAKPAESSEPGPAAPKNIPEKPKAHQDTQADETAKEPGDEEETQAAATVPSARVRKPQTEPAAKAPAGTADDALVTDGERFLYGTGVPANCERARRSLTTAAGHNNPQAQSVLGTMYATGHCVSRDLPSAYRWFARALHADPGNDRVKKDLEVLWRQMSPDERQLAMRSQ